MTKELTTADGGRLNELHKLAKAAATDAIEYAIEAGKLLIETKKDVKHGEWQEWVEKNLNFSDRQARRYMQAANRTLASVLKKDEKLSLSRTIWGHANRGKPAEKKAKDARRPTPEPPSQDAADLRKMHRMFEIAAEFQYPGDVALEKFGAEAMGPKFQAFCEFAYAMISSHRGDIDVSIPLADGTRYHPAAADVELWKKAYPSIDIRQQLLECSAWNDANRTKRKTHKGIKRHIQSWLSRANDKSPAKSHNQSEMDEIAREVAGVSL